MTESDQLASLMTALLARLTSQEGHAVAEKLGSLVTSVENIESTATRIERKLDDTDRRVDMAETDIRDLKHRLGVVEKEREAHAIRWANYVSWGISLSVTIVMILTTLGVIR